MDLKPTVGRIVHFNPGTPEAETFPAIITKVHSEQCVNLEVFGLGVGNKYPTSVLHEASAGGAMRWSWPPRV